jgi:uncharacterized protein YkwD
MQEEHYRKRAMRRLAIIAGVVLIIGLVAWRFSESGTIERIEALKTSAEHIAAQELSKTFNAPEPLVGTSTAGAVGGSGATGTGLTREGDIEATNTQRKDSANLPPLKESMTLDDIAKLRLDDMFANQYFAHVSPASSSAETVAKAVGYSYLALGENLALGTFGGDRAVVAAWMASPGHRENILNTHYTEIGVAVKKGMFQGSESWIAVQVFGRPASDCPKPDATLPAQIDADRVQLSKTYADLQSMQADLNAMDPASKDYADKADTYNAMVAQYNTSLAAIKAETDKYNAQVETYNQCIAKV